MADRGIKIVKEGFPITETDPENMIFTSAKGVLGWRLTTTKTESTDSNGKIDTYYDHNLGYVPQVVVRVTNRAGQKIDVPNQWESDWNVDFVLEENFYFYVDNDKVYLKAYVHRYEPIMGGDDIDVSGQSYTFDVILYFNELNDEV